MVWQGSRERECELNGRDVLRPSDKRLDMRWLACAVVAGPELCPPHLHETLRESGGHTAPGREDLVEQSQIAGAGKIEISFHQFGDAARCRRAKHPLRDSCVTTATHARRIRLVPRTQAAELYAPQARARRSPIPGVLRPFTSKRSPEPCANPSQSRPGAIACIHRPSQRPKHRCSNHCPNPSPAPKRLRWRSRRLRWQDPNPRRPRQPDRANPNHLDANRRYANRPRANRLHANQHRATRLQRPRRDERRRP